MTKKIPIQEIVKMVGYCSDITESMAMSKRETMIDEKIYVAVTRKYVESKSSLVWAIENSGGGKDFCIVYVHQPIQISVAEGKLTDKKLRLYKKEKEKVDKNLDKYLHICRQMHVTAEKIYIEMDSVEKGILQLISQRGVTKLVMGAAADRHYSMRMRDLKSKKAIYIRREAPATCHIWFTCNGYLICSREATTRTENLFLEYASSNSLNQSDIARGLESLPSSSFAKYDDRIKVLVTEADHSKRAKQWENMYLEELKRRNETEKALRKAKEEVEKMRSESETRITESNTIIRKLQYKYNLSMEALRRIREEQEELKIKLREVSKQKKSNHKNHEPPQYFICPITQDVMEDPHVAADGFTYEREAISDWFGRGHETSPMINKKLSHTSLVPNLALRSAIQEWLQASSS